VKSIGQYAFANRRNNALGLSEFNPDAAKVVIDMTKATGIETLSTYAFAYCTAESLTIPATITSLPDRVFYDAMNLQTVNGLDEVTSIGQYAFYRTKITVFDASKLTTVANYAFAGSSIKELNFGPCLL
jgi:hypothetical protein